MQAQADGDIDPKLPPELRDDPDVRALSRVREAAGIAVGLIGVLMLTQGAGFQASTTGLIAISVACITVLGGIGDRINDALLSFVNDQYAEAEAFLNQADARGIFWST